MTDLFVTGPHVIDFSDGRTAEPGSKVENVDLGDPHNQALVDDGHAIVLENQGKSKSDSNEGGDK